MSLLEVSDLTVRFETDDGVRTAVEGLSFSIDRGETLGVVGESGAGKSVTTRAILGLIDSPGRVERGEVRFKGRDLLELEERELRAVRGNEIGMVFQDPQAALNPVYTVGEQIAETIRHHLEYDREGARERAVGLLERVGIPDADSRYSEYPHEFSGGMRQRALLAMALSCEPELLICDEPTSGVDVTVEAQLLAEIDELASEFDVAVQFITHDLGVVAELCDRAMVMYAGRAVEKAPIESLFYDPKHPYTAGLLRAIPRLGVERDRLRPIPGSMPDPGNRPSGCAFHPRCPYAEDVCRRTEPPLLEPESGEPDSGSERSAACLEYSGDLSAELGYEVVVDEHGERGDEGSRTARKTDGRANRTEQRRSERDRSEGGSRD